MRSFVPEPEPRNLDPSKQKTIRNPFRPPLPLSPPVPTSRLRPLISEEPAKPRATIAEVAGATAAGCAALCCCCPCGIAKLLVAVLLKLPAALARRARRALRRRRRRRAKGVKTEPVLWSAEAGASDDDDDDDLSLFHWVPDGAWPAKSAELAELAALEREMAAQFHNAGFWRSLSRRD